jgi:SAM-dependent methyltransferase
MLDKLSRLTSHPVEDAISGLLFEFAKNKWFVDSFWPENERRVRMILGELLRERPPPAKVLDIGCANGFLSVLLRSLGYEVTGTDAAQAPELPRLFEARNISFFRSNLNDERPFRALSDGSFDIAVMGEVIEHILNHPLGLMTEVARVLRSDGFLVLTTPNPSTVVNAMRVLLGTSSLWGTDAFLRLPKMVDGVITDIGDVHFREYRTPELARLLELSGFRLLRVKYFAFGSSSQHPLLKRLVKENLLARQFMSFRVFGSNQMLLATRSA